MTDMNSPDVSIIIPTKDRPAYLLEALASLQAQTLQGWEAIVVDDCSEVDVRSAITPVLKNEARVTFVEREGPVKGAPTCRNQGLAMSHGRYIVFLDDDDGLAPECLASRVAVMDQEPDLDFLVSPSQVFYKHLGDCSLLHNVKTVDDPLERFLCLDAPWQTTGPIWRRTSLDRVGRWKEGLPSFQDWDFHLRALSGGLVYRWSGSSPDCYWRAPLRQTETVGLRSQSDTHLESHQELFLDMIRHFVAEGLLSDRNRNLFAGLFFWLCEAWLRLGKPERAEFTWSIAKEALNLQPPVYERGLRFIRSKSRLWVRKVLRTLLKKPYPDIFRSGDYSRTSLRCKVSSMQM